MVDDLADLTPRRFLRHTTTRAFLATELGVPASEAIHLSDLRPSLANLDHLRNYISKAQDKVFPKGTGWIGLLYAKERQDASGTQSPYIRYMSEIPIREGDRDSSDEADGSSSSDTLRIVICMTPESSRALLHAQYLQCDISFKRVSGFLEFELGMMDPVANISMGVCSNLGLSS